MDSTLSPAQADPHHDGDVVLLAPKDLANAVEAVCRLAYRARLRIGAPAWRDPTFSVCG
jgi:hypothetical protein